MWLNHPTPVIRNPKNSNWTGRDMVTKDTVPRRRNMISRGSVALIKAVAIRLNIDVDSFIGDTILRGLTIKLHLAFPKLIQEGVADGYPLAIPC